MKKHLIVTAMALCFSVVALSQKYSTKTGEVIFEASVPSFEEVKAKNTAVSAILNGETGDFAALVLVKGFRFKVALMEEHFNENYIESEKYPKATLKGSIKDFNMQSLKEGAKDYTMQADLTLHGKTKSLEVPISMQAKNGQVVLTASFMLSPDDFDISIPNIVRNKVAKDVNVSVNFELSK